MTDTALWGALFGMLVPFLVALVDQPEWSSQKRQIAALGVSVVAGMGTVLGSGDFDPTNWVATITAVVAASQASYTLLWKPTGTARKVQRATALNGPWGSPRGSSRDRQGRKRVPNSRKRREDAA